MSSLCWLRTPGFSRPMALRIATGAAALWGLSTEPPGDSRCTPSPFHLLWYGPVTWTHQRAGRGHPSGDLEGPRRRGEQDLGEHVRRLYHNSFSELSPFPRLFSFFTHVLFFPLLSRRSFLPFRASQVLPSLQLAARCPSTPNTHKQRLAEGGAVTGWSA